MSKEACEKNFNELFEKFKKTESVEIGWVASYYGLLAEKYDELAVLFSIMKNKVEERYLKTFFFLSMVFGDCVSADELRSFLLNDCDLLIAHLRVIKEEKNTEKKERVLYNYFGKREKDERMLKAFARFFGAYPKEFHDALLLLRR